MPGAPLLLVEDDPAVGRLMGRVLERAGWAPVLCAEPGEARAAARRQPPGVAVIDLGFGPDGGIALARELRAQVPGVPLLFVSGSPPSPAEREWIDEAGACFLSKPFSPDGLTDVVARLAAAGSA